MIRISPIRLINENDEQMGIIETSDALRMAEEQDLDLVEISPEARPPVCKIMDHGKYKYELSKKEQRSRQASKHQEMKEVRLGRSIKIDPHDVMIRVNRARKFILEGHKVLIVQQFRGREMQHRDLGRDLINSVIDQLDDISKVETPPRQAGRRVSLILAPDKNKVLLYKQRQASAENAKAKDDPKPAVADAPAAPPASKPQADTSATDTKGENSQPAPAVDPAPLTTNES
jgi:translation initiation factor IF-3